MLKRANFALAFVTFPILVIFSLYSLLLPILWKGSGYTWLIPWKPAQGIFWLVIAIAVFAVLFYPVPSGAASMVYLLSTAGLGSISFCLNGMHDIVSASLLWGLAIGNLIAMVNPRRKGKEDSPADLFISILLAIDIILAAGFMLRVMDLQIRIANFLLTSTWAGAIFMGVGLISALHLIPKLPRWLRFLLCRLAGLPWLALGVLRLAYGAWFVGLVCLVVGLIAVFNPEIRKLDNPYAARSMWGKWNIAVLGPTYLGALAVAVVIVAKNDDLMTLIQAGSGLSDSSRISIAYQLLQNQIIAFTVFLALAGLLYLTAFRQRGRVNRWFSGLIQNLNPEVGDPQAFEKWAAIDDDAGQIYRILQPVQEKTRKALDELGEKVNQADHLVEAEKQRNFLYTFSHQMKNLHDPIISSQIVANTLQKAFKSSLVSILTHSHEEDTYLLVASVGPAANTIPIGYRKKINQSLMVKAARLRKTQVCNDTRLEDPLLNLNGQPYLSEVIVPLINNGFLQGIILINDKKASAFSDSDIAAIEAVGAQLLAAWERANLFDHLSELIQAGIFLATVKDPQTLLTQIATIARQAIQARFCLLVIVEDGQTRLGISGSATKLQKSLFSRPELHPVISSAIHAATPFRIRDTRKDPRTDELVTDYFTLTNLLAIPIRVNQTPVGAILAFGRKAGSAFADEDETIANLISLQAASVIENVLLSQERRVSVINAQLLYELSIRITMAERLEHAASAIAETAHTLARANATGLILFTQAGEIEAHVTVGTNPINQGDNLHPMSQIRKAMETGQKITADVGNDVSITCFPMQTTRRRYGVLWMRNQDHRSLKAHTLEHLETLSNQAAVALERSILLTETRQQADELSSAYSELEKTYDQTLSALISSLDARDSETEGHSLRVADLAVRLGKQMELSPQQLKALERGALLHDIGKIGTSDAILNKPGPLNANEWELMKLHPDTGARIVESIPFLQEAIPVIRYHHERWNGEGYPLGLTKTQIPLLARIFAVADTYDALTSDRPYRQRMTPQQAFDYLDSQKKIQFDPDIVEALARVIHELPVRE